MSEVGSREYDCERCGIRVWLAIAHSDDEPCWCMSCRFIESIEDEQVKKEVALALDKNNPMLNGEWSE